MAKKNILILDNDECLGFFGVMSGFYNYLIGEPNLRERLEPNNMKRLKREALYLEFSKDLLDSGFARPGLKTLFKEISQLKGGGKLDYVVMYTSAQRNDGSHQNRYNDWVATLRNILENYTGYNVYDMDHSGRSDEHPMMETPDGATLKSVGRIIRKLGLSKEQVGRVVFFDDRPQNIECKHDCIPSTVTKTGLKPYMYLPKYDRILNVCLRWDRQFIDNGLPQPSKLLPGLYKEEVSYMAEDGIKPGGIRKDV